MFLRWIPDVRDPEDETGGGGGGSPSPEPAEPSSVAPKSSETDGPRSVKSEDYVEVAGERVKVADLLESRRKAEELQEYRRHASTILNSWDGAVTPEREQAIRYVMSQEGWQPQDIETYVDYLKKGESPEDPEVDRTPSADPSDTPRRTPSREPQGAPPDPMSEGPGPQTQAELEKMRQRLQEYEAERGQERVQQLHDYLDQAIESVLDTEGEVGVLLKRMEKLAAPSEESGEDRRKRLEGRTTVLKDDLSRETIAILRRWKASGREMSRGTFLEAAREAEKEVARRIRAVIGDPNQLGRAPETATGDIGLMRPPKPQDPKVEPSDTTHSIMDKAKRFTEDTLRELAWEIDKGGKSVV